MNERLIMRGQLAELQRELNEKELEASGLIILIRTLLNPYTNTYELETDKALVTAKTLHERVKEIKELREKIKKLKEVVDG